MGVQAVSGLSPLTVLTLTPLVAGLVILAFLRRRPGLVRGVAMGGALVSLVIVLFVWGGFASDSTSLQFVERHAWIPTLGVEYFVGIDGIGLILLLLTAILVPFAMAVSWRTGDRPALYFSLVLFLEAGLFGTFTALSFFHWFLFWEISLVPAFFLIRLWGGPQRAWAATQFFVYTMVGSVAMLLGFLALALGTRTFDFIRLAELAAGGGLGAMLASQIGWEGATPESISLIVFLAVFLGFAVKVPMMPFHTWLPATYAEAPTAITILLTGVMSKMGVYGLLRILLPIFPEQMRAVLGPLLWLAVITILFSAFAALAQKDLKRMLAYSSINHLGYCLLGVFASARLMAGEGVWPNEKAAALNGVVLQMFNHGLAASALFCFVGFLEERSQGRRGLDDFGGLRAIAPVFCGLMGIAIFASLGLPGLNGFVSEFLIFKGSFSLAWWPTAFSALGLLITAVFLLSLLQKVFYGPLDRRWAEFRDLRPREAALVVPMTALLFLIGIYPQFLIKLINPAVRELVARLG